MIINKIETTKTEKLQKETAVNTGNQKPATAGKQESKEKMGKAKEVLLVASDDTNKSEDEKKPEVQTATVIPPVILPIVQALAGPVGTAAGYIEGRYEPELIQTAQQAPPKTESGTVYKQAGDQ